MSRREPTPEQKAAIDAAGEVLVSASAGSGKTFVMIEKMIALILGEKADVDSVLAVTFTNLAAGEMKERLRAALAARLGVEEDPARRARLKAQLSDIAAADICTLHAFCGNVIRRYFYEAGIDGGFRVLEEKEADKLRERAAVRAFEKLQAEQSPSFAALCRACATSRGFAQLRRRVIKLHEKVIVRADYREFLAGIAEKYTEDSFAALEREALAPVRAAAERLRARCEELLRECGRLRPTGLFGEKHTAFLAGRIAAAEAVLAAPDVFAAAAAFAGLKFASKPSKKDIEASGSAEAAALDEALADVKKETDAVKELLKEFRPREEELADFLLSRAVAAGFAEAVLAYDAEYAACKRRAGGLDFSDLEHGCLRLLSVPRVREEVRGRYTHLFVDEYQDSSPVQERILSLVAGENVFMVGDAKQSIYGFRGCDPAFFTEKYERLSREGRALTLNGNFRSSTAVLDAVNRLFSRAMTSESCSVDYAHTSMMAAGLPAQSGGRVRAAFVPEEEKAAPAQRDIYSVADRLGPVEDEEFAEGALIADIIRQEVGTLRLDPATGEQVRTEFGDIVLLTRSMTGFAGRVVGELVRRGIPVAAATDVNICDYPEVKAMIALLQFLDNGAQDIPLAASLKSALGGLTDAELAAVRLAGKRPGGKDEPFYLACERYAAQGRDALAEKLRRFYARAASLRLRMQVKGAGEVIAAILAETGMEADLLALPCGEERVRRIRRLAEESGNLSVPAFLEQLRCGGYKVGYAESGGDGAVRVMTMHASKGLEFPVVIVAGMSRDFARQDLQEEILFDDEWGPVPYAYHPEERTRQKTILREVVRRRLLRRRAADEMRLLYVALTRAKSALYLVFGKVKPYDPARAECASCFADFVDLQDLEGCEAPVFGGRLEPPAARVLAAGGVDEAAREAVRALYCEPYPHAAALGLPVKTSPSQLLRERRSFAAGAEGNASPRGEGHIPSPSAAEAGASAPGAEAAPFPLGAEAGTSAPGEAAASPSLGAEAGVFAPGEAASSPLGVGAGLFSLPDAEESDLAARAAEERYASPADAATGTAYHAFLERADFAAPAADEIARVCALLPPAQAALLDADRLAAILAMPVFAGLRGARLYREQPFLLGLPASRLYAGASEDTVLVQGVVDLLAVRGEEAVVVDYKYSSLSEQTLREEYAPQMEIYAEAASRWPGVRRVSSYLVNILRGYCVRMR